ncbi:PKD domain-containing protein [Vibrio breoganii]
MNTKLLFTERGQQSEPLLKQLKPITISRCKVPIYKSCFFDFEKRNLLENHSIFALTKELPSSETIQVLNSFLRQFYYEFSQPALKFFSLTLCACGLLAADKSYAEVVQYRAEGVITSFQGDQSLLPLAGNVGDEFSVIFSFDTDTTDTQTSIDYQGRYPAESLTLTYGGNAPAEATNPLISTQSAPFSDLWGVSGCLASCESQDTNIVRLNFFLPTGSVESDALTLPPNPVPVGTQVQFGLFSRDDASSATAFAIASLNSIEPYTESTSYEYINLESVLGIGLGGGIFGATIDNEGNVAIYTADFNFENTFIWRADKNGLIDGALPFTPTPESQPYLSTFIVNDNGLLIYDQYNTVDRNLQFLSLDYLNNVLDANFAATEPGRGTLNSGPNNVNNSGEIAFRQYSDTRGQHELVITDGSSTQRFAVNLGVELVGSNTKVSMSNNGDALFYQKFRYQDGGRFFFKEHGSSTGFVTKDVTDISDVGHIDGINDYGISTFVAIDSDNSSESVHLLNKTQSLKVFPYAGSYSDYTRILNKARINNQNQVLIATGKSGENTTLMVISPQVTSGGDIIGSPLVQPTIVYDNVGEYFTTDGGHIVSATSNDSNFRTSFDFNDQGEIVFTGVVCAPNNSQDCNPALILARPISVGPSNEAPIADAGIDVSIRAGDSILLDGTGSYDDNTPTGLLLFNWSVTVAPEGSSAAANFIGNDSSMPTLVTDLPGEYKVTLQVTDEQSLNSNLDEVIISTENLAPSTDAGSDQLVVIGTLVILDGSNSYDPEGESLSYRWSISSAPSGSTAALSGVDWAMPSITPDLEGIYEVALIVSDSLGAGAPASVTITATMPEEFAEIEVIEANNVVVELDPVEVTTEGHQGAMTNFMAQTATALESGDIEEAILKLQQAISRVDGCALRGEPDGKGKDRDWVTNCEAQDEVYASLTAALQALLDSQE